MADSRDGRGLAWLLLLALRLPAQTAPQGWNSTTEPFPRGGKCLVFTPADLGVGERLTLTCTPLVAQGGKVLLEFLDAFADEDMKTLGKPTGKPGQATGSTPNAATTTRAVTVRDGRLTLLYFGISVDRENARVLRVAFLGDGATLKRHGKEIAAVNASLVEAEKKEAVRSGRGVDLEAVPTAPTGLKPGGKLVPGIYAGNRLEAGGKIRNRFRLYLYEDLQFRICNDAGVELGDGNGSFRYDPTTGKLDISVTKGFWNDRRDPDDEKCLYGRDRNGKACVYTYDDYGVGHTEARLWLVGPTDRPSPREEKELARRIEAEKKRYKFVVEPGKGLTLDQIEGIHHDVKFTNDPILGSRSVDSIYLVLKDGTLRDGLPVAVDELDVSLSRRREPEVWGRWKRVGDALHVAWRDAPESFAPLAGSWAVRAEADAPLSGMFETAMTTGNLITGSGFHFWGVTFLPDHRFEKHKRGGFGNGSLAQTLNDTYIFSSYDDEGATASASTPGVFTGSTTRKPKGSDRKGKYSIEGWTLVLESEDGARTRTPFFFTDEKRSAVYFEGASMGRK